MMIQGKRIRNINNYLLGFEEGDKFYIGLQNADVYVDELRKYGRFIDLSSTYNFIPRPLKPVTDFNVNGKMVIDKSLPMEERTFEREYHVVDWHGNDHYGTCYQTRLCYQRRLIQPPNIELTYTNGLLISPLLIYSQDNEDLIKHIINIFLEIFGICETMTEQYTPKEIRTERLTWTILPKGEYPWEKAKSHLEMIINSLPNNHRAIISKRHEAITENIPDFMAIGDESFWGYVIYGFTKKELYVFESNKPNNATYVFKGNWKEASKLTKAEILFGQHHEARIIHNKNWNNFISKLISA